MKTIKGTVVTTINKCSTLKEGDYIGVEINNDKAFLAYNKYEIYKTHLPLCVSTK